MKKSAVVLAAGVGKRLKSENKLMPKCLFEIAGKPLIYYTLTKLLNQHYNNICVVTGYRASDVENYILTTFKGIKTIFNPNFEKYGNFESLKMGLDKLSEAEQVTVFDADLIFEEEILNKIKVSENEILTSKIGKNHDPVYVGFSRNKIDYISKNAKYTDLSLYEYVGVFNLNKSNIDRLYNIDPRNKSDYEEIFDRVKLDFTQVDVTNFHWYELDDIVHMENIRSLPPEVLSKPID